MYKHEHDIENALIDSPAHIEDGTFDELKEVYQKAEVFENIRKFVTKRLKEEKTTDEYDYGERFMCEEIKKLLEEE